MLELVPQSTRAEGSAPLARPRLGVPMTGWRERPDPKTGRWDGGLGPEACSAPRRDWLAEASPAVEVVGSRECPEPSSWFTSVRTLPAHLPHVVQQPVQIRSAEIVSAEDDTLDLRGVVHVGKWIAAEKHE